MKYSFICRCTGAGGVYLSLAGLSLEGVGGGLVPLLQAGADFVPWGHFASETLILGQG